MCLSYKENVRILIEYEWIKQGIITKASFFYFAISIRNWKDWTPEGNDVAVNVLEEYLNKD